MKFVLDPVLWIFLLAVLIAAHALFHRRSASGVVFLTVVLALLGSPAFGNLWLKTLERQFPLRACSADASTTVIVLGGGLDTRYPVEDAAERLSHTSWRRAMAAPELLQANGVLLLSGGSVRHSGGELSEAHSMAALLKPLVSDIGGLRVLQETGSRNTYDNAQFSAAALRAIDVPLDVVLVTSASHMLRAKATFEQAGFSVCAHAVAPESQPRIPWGALLPQLSGLTKSAVAIREWAANVLYRWQGWA